MHKIAELASTWRPDDLCYRADVYRQTMVSLSYRSFACFHATKCPGRTSI